MTRVTNTTGKGGFVPDKPYFMTTGSDTIDLKGTWQYKVGACFSARPRRAASTARASEPTHSIVQCDDRSGSAMKIKGFFMVSGRIQHRNPEPYNALLPALINNWRALWHDHHLPFLVAQLPNFQDIDYTPAESNIALLREAQNQALTLPNTAVTVTIDLGEWNDIHPLNKKGVGERLALAARNLAYGEKQVGYSGPVLKSHTIENSRVLLTFDHVGEGIVSSDGDALRWFAVAAPIRSSTGQKQKYAGKTGSHCAASRSNPRICAVCLAG